MKHNNKKLKQDLSDINLHTAFKNKTFAPIYFAVYFQLDTVVKCDELTGVIRNNVQNEKISIRLS